MFSWHLELVSILSMDSVSPRTQFLLYVTVASLYMWTRIRIPYSVACRLNRVCGRGEGLLAFSQVSSGGKDQLPCVSFPMSCALAGSRGEVSVLYCGGLTHRKGAVIFSLCLLMAGAVLFSSSQSTTETFLHLVAPRYHPTIIAFHRFLLPADSPSGAVLFHL